MKTEYAIDWRKTAAEIQDDYALVCKQRDELLAALQVARQGYCDAAIESTNPDEVEWAQGYLDEIDAVLIKFGIAQEGGAA